MYLGDPGRLEQQCMEWVLEWMVENRAADQQLLVWARRVLTLISPSRQTVSECARRRKLDESWLDDNMYSKLEASYSGSYDSATGGVSCNDPCEFPWSIIDCRDTGAITAHPNSGTVTAPPSPNPRALIPLSAQASIPPVVASTLV